MSHVGADGTINLWDKESKTRLKSTSPASLPLETLADLETAFDNRGGRTLPPTFPSK